MNKNKIWAVFFFFSGIVCIMAGIPVLGVLEFTASVMAWFAPVSGEKGKTDGPASGDNAPSNGGASASGKSSRKEAKNSSADVAANQTPAVRICPRCGRQQPEGRIFCSECGERLKQQ